jgi:hypothetical protein
MYIINPEKKKTTKKMECIALRLDDNNLYYVTEH